MILRWRLKSRQEGLRPTVPVVGQSAERPTGATSVAGASLTVLPAALARMFLRPLLGDAVKIRHYISPPSARRALGSRFLLRALGGWFYTQKLHLVALAGNSSHASTTFACTAYMPSPVSGR
jgi:hypothetical protein